MNATSTTLGLISQTSTIPESATKHSGLFIWYSLSLRRPDAPNLRGKLHGVKGFWNDIQCPQPLVQRHLCGLHLGRHEDHGRFGRRR